MSDFLLSAGGTRGAIQSKKQALIFPTTTQLGVGFFGFFFFKSETYFRFGQTDPAWIQVFHLHSLKPFDDTRFILMVLSTMKRTTVSVLPNQNRAGLVVLSD